MLAHRLAVAEIMKLMDKAVEQFFSGALPNLVQDNRSKFSHCGIDGILSYDNFFRRLTPGKRIGRGGFSRWQREVPFPLQFEHQSPADHVLEIAVGLHPVPCPAHLAGQLTATDVRLLYDEATNKVNVVIGDQSFAVCEYLGHVDTMTDLGAERKGKIKI